MINKKWWKLTFQLGKEIEELILWKLHELRIFSFAFNYSKEEQKKLLLEIWLPKENWDQKARNNLQEKLSVFLRQNGLSKIEFSWILIKEEDWRESWKKYWEPSEIGDNFVVLPSWMKLPKEFCNKKVIKIDPGAAFGTGSHPSTSLCVEEIERNSVDQKKILDIGSGSGILTITARLLGASKLYALDIDSLACKSTAENFQLNFGNLNGLKIYEGEPLDFAKEDEFKDFDYIVCNILAGVIVDIIPLITNFLSKNGKVILSGIITSQKEEIIKVLNLNKFEVVNVSSKNNWICINAKKITMK